MPEKNAKKTHQTVAAATATGPADLTVLAEQFIQQLRAMRDQIPDFTLPHDSYRKITGISARIPEAVVDSALVACGDSAALAAAVNVPAVQFAQQYEKSFGALRDELKTTFEGLNYTIRVKRYGNGQAALRVLNIARRLAKAPENAYLTTHITEIENGLHRRRKVNGKVPVPAPPPAATP